MTPNEQTLGKRTCQGCGGAFVAKELTTYREICTDKEILLILCDECAVGWENILERHGEA